MFWTGNLLEKHEEIYAKSQKNSVVESELNNGYNFVPIYVHQILLEFCMIFNKSFIFIIHICQFIWTFSLKGHHMLYKMKCVYLWVISRAIMCLINTLYSESQKDRDDVTWNLNFLSLKQMGKHLVYSITLELHSTLINATEDTNFTILDQWLNFK